MEQIISIENRRGIVVIAFDAAPPLAVRKKHFDKRPLSTGDSVDIAAYIDALAALQFSDAYEDALTSLDRSARSARQLHDALLRKGYVPAAADAAVERLRENGLIDDAALALRMAESNSKNAIGRYAFRKKLMAKGISDEEAEAALGTFDDEQQRDAARTVLGKYARRYEGLPRREARAKLSQVLARRGFSWDVISSVIDDGPYD